ncbi:MAG: PBECR4 domain-containing protein [Bacteroidia bacterium]|nr:PBECR4 domain-containing protein [Bacteroidia bacterium]
MASRSEKKESIRTQIISAAQVYGTELAGKDFLYVFGERYFQLRFKRESFMHLTGVASYLNSRRFYDYAKRAILTTRQFYFSTEHSYDGAKKKLPCLIRLPELTNSLVCVIEDLRTVTLTYKIGVTNLLFTLGLTENTNEEGQKLDDFYLPRTLRVNDHSIENSSDGEFIDFIFSKDSSMDKYDTVCFSDEGKTVPDEVKGYLSPELVAELD